MFVPNGAVKRVHFQGGGILQRGGNAWLYTTFDGFQLHFAKAPQAVFHR